MYKSQIPIILRHFGHSVKDPEEIEKAIPWIDGDDRKTTEKRLGKKISIRVRGNCYNCNNSYAITFAIHFIITIMPEHPVSARRVILSICLKNFPPISHRQSIMPVRLQRFGSQIGLQVTQCLSNLLENAF